MFGRYAWFRARSCFVLVTATAKVPNTGRNHLTLRVPVRPRRVGPGAAPRRTRNKPSNMSIGASPDRVRGACRVAHPARTFPPQPLPAALGSARYLSWRTPVVTRHTTASARRPALRLALHPSDLAHRPPRETEWNLTRKNNETHTRRASPEPTSLFRASRAPRGAIEGQRSLDYGQKPTPGITRKKTVGAYNLPRLSEGLPRGTDFKVKTVNL